jgi:hypothetical protein
VKEASRQKVGLEVDLLRNHRFLLATDFLIVGNRQLRAGDDARTSGNEAPKRRGGQVAGVLDEMFFARQLHFRGCA